MWPKWIQLRSNFVQDAKSQSWIEPYCALGILVFSLSSWQSASHKEAQPEVLQLE